jgi:hypothetical protein
MLSCESASNYGVVAPYLQLQTAAMHTSFTWPCPEYADTRANRRSPGFGGHTHSISLICSAAETCHVRPSDGARYSTERFS